MSHIALYRAWRPQLFRDIVGQSHITRTLQNAMKTGRFSHAYLFSGPRGTGKTSAAKILAKAVNCEQSGDSGEPCNQCAACERITDSAVMDVVEIDAASNRGVEEIRDIRDKVKYAPTEVKYKVYIIDEVHMLTTEAFNALLKTLEEPPKHVLFVLATTEPNRLPATIISRCQRFDFRRVSLQDQMDRIAYICEQEQIAIEPEALQYIARLSDGGMRDALSLLDQIVSYGEETVTYEQAVALTGGLASEQFAALAEAVHKGETGSILTMIETWMSEGKHIENCMDSLIHFFRDLLLLQMVPDSAHLTERVLDADGFRDTAALFSKDALFQMIDTLSHYRNEMKYASHPQTILEIALLKLSYLPQQAQGAGAAASSAQMPGGSQAQAGAAMQADASSEIAQLTAKVKELERAVQALQRQAAGGGGGVAAGPASAGGGASLHGHGQAASQAPSRKPPVPVQAGGGTLSSTALQAYRAKHDQAAFREIAAKWPEILHTVKERKITVHAWFVDGEPVAVTDSSVLVAFKNTIHRETTQKPANKALIESVIQEKIGRALQLDTVMQKDWQAAGHAAAQTEQPEALQWASPDADPVEGDASSGDAVKAAQGGGSQQAGGSADTRGHSPAKQSPHDMQQDAVQKASGNAVQGTAPSGASGASQAAATSDSASSASQGAASSSAAAGPSASHGDLQGAARGSSAGGAARQDGAGERPGDDPEWVTEALRLFGEDIVEVKRESDR